MTRPLPAPAPVPAPGPPYDAVLLDLDGTLTQAGPAITAAIRVALEHVGHPVPAQATLETFVGPPLATSFAALPGFDPARVDDALAVYRASYDRLSSPLYDGVPELLAALSGAGVPVSLATSKPEVYAHQIVEAKGLLPHLAHVTGSGVDGSLPTKADVVGLALQRLGHPRRAVMVGDRRYDVEGAAAHGLPCLGALWGYGSEAELREAGAAALVPSPRALLPLLLG